MSEIVTIGLDDLPLARAFADRWIRPGYIVMDDALFDWQFLRPIDGDAHEPATFAVRSCDELTAIAFARRHTCRVGGRRVTGSWLHEWFADDRHPGSGMILLRRLLGDGFHGAAGQSSLAQNVFSRLAPVCAFDLDRLYAVVDAPATHALLVRTGPDAMATLTLRSVPNPRPGVSVEIPATFDETYDADWEAFAATLSVATDRSAGFMRWRYLDHPEFDYERRRVTTRTGAVWFVWREECVAGHPKPVARLCEAIGARAALVDAFPALFAELRDRNVAMVDWSGSHAATTAGLLAGGMRHVIVQPGFDLPRLFAPLADDPRKRINIAFALGRDADSEARFAHTGAYFTKGDVNQDRPNRAMGT